MRDALRLLHPKVLDALIIEALEATEEAWRQVAVDRVRAFVAEQPKDGPPMLAAYFTTVEHRAADGLHLRWNPIVAALASTEDTPDLGHTHTAARAIGLGERLAALDRPTHEDVLRVHLPTGRITRMRP
ncbi:hypothetical protein ACSHXN_43895 (plasmid) [Streptomyces sp. HUAS TT11]|uniref:hypothetical protein n=1 Tax=Streptomyces sp. HUAS TT11 TaxID=3447508 RepID=UPI003F65F9F8